MLGPKYERAGVRLQHLANTLSGSTTVVDSLHSRPYRAQEAGQDLLAEEREFRVNSMATAQQHVKFAYTIVYVQDVEQAIQFYKKAFGLSVRSLDHAGSGQSKWGELESGSTTLAFTKIDQHETHITGGKPQTTDLGEPRHNVELYFDYSDVDSAFEHAVQEGAVPVAKPEMKPWGRKEGYVRDSNGVMIRMGSQQ